MFNIEFNNNKLTNSLIVKRLGKTVLRLPESWLKRLGKPSVKEQEIEKERLKSKILLSYNVSVDKLITVLGNELSSLLYVSKQQPENKWQHKTLYLPVKLTNKFRLKPFECLYYGGIYRPEEISLQKPKAGTFTDDEELYEKQFKYIKLNHLFVIAPKGQETINVSKDAETLFENPYANIKMGKEQISFQNIINKVLDNLVADNLIESGVFTKEEVKKALGEDYIEVPTSEEAKKREIKYTYKPEKPEKHAMVVETENGPEIKYFTEEELVNVSMKNTTNNENEVVNNTNEDVMKNVEKIDIEEFYNDEPQK